MASGRRLGGACALLAMMVVTACAGDRPSDKDDQACGANCATVSMPGAGSGGTTAPSNNMSGGATTMTTGTGGTPAMTGTGGSPTTAGPAGMGGGMTPTMMGGSGGTPAMNGTGGSGDMNPIEQVPSMPSSGCGASDFPASGNFTIDVMGTSRDYIVALPNNYDANTPYKLIFAWHGLGGTAMQVAGGFGGFGYYGLQGMAGDTAIFVAGQGLETQQGGAGWPNTGGQDINFVKGLLDWLRSKYCVDEKRIFSVGMSYGGIMSNTIGCQLGGVFRAIAPMSGSGPLSFGGNQCMGQVAVWQSHGDMDDVVSTASGEMSRDHWVMANHCTMESQPVDPDPCVAYQGCDADFPVTWCEFAGGHTIPPFASAAIWKFLSQF